MSVTNAASSTVGSSAEEIANGATLRRHVNTEPLSITLLGTGTSTGVPVLGCNCDVCLSEDPRDTRTRCSCFVRAGDMGLLIDTGPDFRRQALTHEIGRIDAVCYTHHHFDHVVGLDDLRPFFFQNATVMPCYAHPDTARVLRRTYDYIFGADPYPGAANVELEPVSGPFTVPSRYAGDISLPVDPILLDHGKVPVYGYRIGRFAYLTDTNNIPESSLSALEGVDMLVLDGLRPEPHPTHLSFEEAVEVARQIGSKQTYLVHVTHAVRHAEANARLPEDVHLGYDGLTFDVPALEPTEREGTS